MKYPFTKQEGYKDCGVACLSMIIKYYNGYVSLDYLRDITNTNKNGVDAFHLIGGADEIGFDTKGFRCDIEQLKSVTFPCIAHVTIDKKINHFVVIYEMNNKFIRIGDPASGIVKMNINDFKEIFNNIIISLYPIKTLPFHSTNKTIIKLSLELFRKYKKMSLFVITLSSLITLLTVFTSFYFKFIYEATFNSYSKIILVFIIFFILYLYKVITDYFRNKVLILLNYKIDLSLTKEIFTHIFSLPYNFFKSRTTGEVVQRINDLNNIKNNIGKLFITLFIDFVLAFISMIVLLFINKYIFIITLLIIFLYFILSFLFYKLYKKYIDKIHNQRADLNSCLTESISAYETINGLNLKQKIIKKINRKYVLHLNHLFKFNSLCNLESLFKELIYNLGFCFLLMYGSYLSYKNIITLGDLISINALFIYLFDPIKNIVNSFVDFKEMDVSIKRVFDMEPLNEENGFTFDSIDSINFKNTKFSYDKDINILNGLNLFIKKKDKIFITGESGSGKSTIFKILKKYYSLKDNSVFINGENINSISSYFIDSKIVYVSQMEKLFTDSLYNNIKLDRNIDDDKILKSLDMCCVKDIYNKNNLGINMLIEENGYNLSGGQRQRIVLARSLLNDFDVLIIDEGLNQVDISLERKILKKIIKFYSDKIIIYVSHRKNNIDLFNRYINISKGKIDIDEVRNR